MFKKNNLCTELLYITSRIGIHLIGPSTPAPFVMAARLFEATAGLRNPTLAATGSSSVAEREVVAAARSGTAPVWGAKAVGTATS
jgi:hypothetical protein